jgi:hypothetical protein
MVENNTTITIKAPQDKNAIDSKKAKARPRRVDRMYRK